MELAAAQRPKKIRIGDMLISEGVITSEQLDMALSDQKRTGKKLGAVLVENGYVDESRLLNLLAQQLNIPFVDLKRFPYKPETIKILPETHARRFRAIALEDRGQSLLIGMADPTNLFSYDELSRVLRKPIELAVVREADLLDIIDQMYRRTDEISGIAAEMEQALATTEDIALDQLETTGNAADAPVVRLLKSVLEDAVQVNASDIHIEPGERDLRIRFRQDGVLRVQTSADRRIASALVSRVKLMAGMDISEKRLPQDGRFQMRVREKTIDIRLSTVPTQNGESVVMRLLNQSSGMLSLSHLGLPDGSLKRFKRLISAPYGMVLVTGPTGSGKTTSLYAALQELNRTEAKIITVEDPVEYRLPGITQVQVNSKIDLTFTRILRTLLRQDPDIVLIGEMRDDETVEIGLRAAMTGHLVLSTLHTNDAISTPLRLADMGAEPFLIASSLRGVVAQRLVRKVCGSCAVPFEPTEADRQLIESSLGKMPGNASFVRGRGCTHCNSTGYHGRTPVFEILEMNDELARVMQKGDPVAFSEAAHKQSGYQSLRVAALELAAAGMTTLDQVRRATFGVEAD
ncbi:MAG: GspE/PulE family protein [Gammaproteobacteria bacterium]|nr:GspE/PulE family protein [Gammaproteobacteria bacterium]